MTSASKKKQNFFSKDLDSIASIEFILFLSLARRYCNQEEIHYKICLYFILSSKEKSHVYTQNRFYV